MRGSLQAGAFRCFTWQASGTCQCRIASLWPRKTKRACGSWALAHEVRIHAVSVKVICQNHLRERVGFHVDSKMKVAPAAADGTD
jgi:hypothetical protein